MRFYVAHNGTLSWYTLQDDSSSVGFDSSSEPVYYYPLLTIDPQEAITLYNPRVPTQEDPANDLSTKDYQYFFQITVEEGVTWYCDFDLPSLLNTDRSYISDRTKMSLTSYCFSELFRGCPLPEEASVYLGDVPYRCLYKTFADTIVTVPPIISVLNVSKGAFESAFEGSALKRFPLIVVEGDGYDESSSSGGSGYQDCFKRLCANCTSLEDAVIWWDDIKPNSCTELLKGCSNLKSVNVRFEHWTPGATKGWLDDVAQEGAFIGFPSLLTDDSSVSSDSSSSDSYTTSRIPAGWAFKGHGDYLTFYMTVPGGSFDVVMKDPQSSWGGRPQFEYRYWIASSGTWSPWTYMQLDGGTIHLDYSVNTNKVQLRRHPQATQCTLSDEKTWYILTLSARTSIQNYKITDNIFCSGDVDSLINWEPLTEYCFTRLFAGTPIRSVPNLFNTEMAPNCCERMYFGCVRLTDGGTIHDGTLAVHCFRLMFAGCLNLRHLKVEFTSWYDPGYVGQADFMPTQDWLSDVYESGTFGKPEELSEICGTSGNPWCDSPGDSDSSDDPPFGIDPDNPPPLDSIVSVNALCIIGYIPESMCEGVLDLEAWEGFSNALSSCLSLGTIRRVPINITEERVIWNDRYNCAPVYQGAMWQFSEVPTVYIPKNAWVIAGTPLANGQGSDVQWNWNSRFVCKPGISEISGTVYEKFIEGQYCGSALSQRGYIAHGTPYANSPKNDCVSILPPSSVFIFSKNTEPPTYITSYKAFVSGKVTFILSGFKDDRSSRVSSSSGICKYRFISSSIFCPDLANCQKLPDYCAGYWISVTEVYVAGSFYQAYASVYSTDTESIYYHDPAGYDHSECKPHCEEFPCDIPPDCSKTYIATMGIKTLEEAQETAEEIVRAIYCKEDPYSQECTG